jgi:ABC-type amino acid transport substrate-binding protein
MQKRLGALGAALLGSFVIVACVAAFTTNGSKTSPSPTRTVTQSPTAPPPSTGSTASTTLAKDEYVSTMVPAGIGTVKVAVGAGSSGLDNALANALSSVMGVPWKITAVKASNETIVADVHSGQYDIGLSDLTENNEREHKVDFLTYLLSAPPNGPQGIAFNKNYGLEKATEAALVVLIADGELQKLFSQWQPAQATPLNSISQVTITAATS